MSRSRRVPVDKEFYRGILSPSEFNAIVDWGAVRNGQFAKALGKRGPLSSLSRRIRDLRALEVAPPPPPPPLAQVWRADAYPATEPAAAHAAHADHAHAAEDDVQVIEVPVPITAAVLPASTPAAAATSYIQKVGAAASQFMLQMSNATTDFVNEAATGAPSSSSNPAQCPICFEPVKDPYMGRCSHIYCKDCLMAPQMQTQQIDEFGGIQALRVRRCPQCRREGISFYKML